MVLGPRSKYRSKKYETNFNYLDQIALQNGAQPKVQMDIPNKEDILSLSPARNTVLSVGAPGGSSQKTKTHKQKQTNQKTKTIKQKQTNAQSTDIFKKMDEFEVTLDEMLKELYDYYASQIKYQFDISASKSDITSAMKKALNKWFSIVAAIPGVRPTPFDNSDVRSCIDEAFKSLGVKLDTTEKQDLSAIYGMIFYGIGLLSAGKNDLGLIHKIDGHLNNFLIKK